MNEWMNLQMNKQMMNEMCFEAVAYELLNDNKCLPRQQIWGIQWLFKIKCLKFFQVKDITITLWDL